MKNISRSMIIMSSIYGLLYSDVKAAPNATTADEIADYCSKTNTAILVYDENEIQEKVSVFNELTKVAQERYKEIHIDTEEKKRKMEEQYKKIEDARNNKSSKNEINTLESRFKQMEDTYSRENNLKIEELNDFIKESNKKIANALQKITKQICDDVRDALKKKYGKDYQIYTVSKNMFMSDSKTHNNDITNMIIKGFNGVKIDIDEEKKNKTSVNSKYNKLAGNRNKNARDKNKTLIYT